MVGVVVEDTVVSILAAVEVLVVGLVTVGSGSKGLRQVVSLHSSGQNSWILLQIPLPAKGETRSCD